MTVYIIEDYNSYDHTVIAISADRTLAEEWINDNSTADDDFEIREIELPETVVVL